MTNKQRVSLFIIIILVGSALILTAVYFFYSFYRVKIPTPIPVSKVRTILSDQEKFGEPFGIVAKNGEIFFSDGDAGKIRRVSDYQNFTVVTDKLNTPSQIAFDGNGDLIVADSGAHTIKRVKISNGAVEIVAGVENQTGYADGDAKSALFNAPVGVAVSGDKIFVADTYNDKIRLIENGVVSTVAGSAQGFADNENGLAAKFDTPCGLAIWNDKLLVADLENRRLRVVEANGKTWTLAGNDKQESLDGFLAEASFVAPTAVTVGVFGEIYVADGNSIRLIGRRLFASVETITNTKRGFADGDLRQARFNRPSGLAIDETGDLLVADAENQAIRILTGAADVGREISREEFKKRGFTPEEFRALQPPRWTYDPPDAKREIAGTLGEIRGEIKDANSQVHFHNGLDVAGGFGETARFVRTEKVLNPSAVDNFATLRELIRMPTMGYIHISLGRDQSGKIFEDNRFIFNKEDNVVSQGDWFDKNGRLTGDKRVRQGKLIGVRVPRGAKFEAGEAIGTLNPMNHVHLIAGRSGAEMNALDALVLPGLSDSIAPKIERVALFDESWKLIGETKSTGSRIKLDGKTRVVVRAYDRVDGNSERRRLGVYRVGYQILNEDKSPVSDVNWTITFDRLPDEEAVKYVYAVGSKSGATGETIFDYIATNQVEGDSFREDFFGAGQLNSGNYVLRVFAADFFGNITSEDTSFVR
jgi:sugar lactone lactonase YvrE